MNSNAYEYFFDLSGDFILEKNAVLADYCTYGIGGPADCMAFPASSQAMAFLISKCRQEKLPFLIIGNGSNLLFDDRGFRGLVINTCRDMKELALLDGGRIKAGAGVQLHDLSIFALFHNLKGLEFCEGIPGTVGGGVYMNAGAYGGNMAGVLEDIWVVNSEGQEQIISKNDLCFQERYSRLQSEEMVLTSAVFKLTAAGKDDFACFKEIFDDMRRCIRLRATFQPALDDMGSPDLYPEPSAGSVFAKISGLAEGDCSPKQWIAHAGLEGCEIGGARVSTKHPNFIINTGSASADDVWQLIKHIKDKVEDCIFTERGIRVTMQPEIIVLDELGRRIKED